MKLLWVFPILIVCIAAKQQLDWTKTYTGYPQPLEFEEYIKGEQMFTCDGPFALCSFAECVVVSGSNPLVAECGCYSFKGKTLSSSGGWLRADAAKETRDACKKMSSEKKKPQYCLKNTNAAPLCKRINSGTLYSNRYPLVSIFNPVDWQIATQTPETVATNHTTCTNGGTVADCYTAACISAPPSSPFLTTKTNATCYCPIYNVKPSGQFSVGSTAPGACGPKTLAGLKPDTIIYNGT